MGVTRFGAFSSHINAKVRCALQHRACKNALKTEHASQLKLPEGPSAGGMQTRRTPDSSFNCHCSLSSSQPGLLRRRRATLETLKGRLHIIMLAAAIADTDAHSLRESKGHPGRPQDPLLNICRHTYCSPFPRAGPSAKGLRFWCKV